MLKILIVEDEIGIVALLKNLIQFQKLGLELVDTAVTGSQALEIMEKTDPDIVITDICMPGMSGLELIENARRKNFKAKYVIISGYSQFDYAVTAIKLGVQDYLLKPISKTELNEVLEKLVLSIQSENDAAQSLKLMNFHVRNQRKKLRKRLFLDLMLNSRSWGKKSLKEINADYGYAFREEFMFFTGIMQLDGTHDWNMVMKKKLLEQMTRIFKREMPECCEEKETCVYNDKFIFLINIAPERLNDAKVAVSNIWQLFQNLAENHRNLRLTMGCGKPAHSAEEIGTSLCSADKVLACRILKGCDKIYYAEDYTGLPATLSEQDFLRYKLNFSDIISGKKSETSEKEIRAYLEWILEFSENSPMLLMDNIGKGIYYLLLELSRQGRINEDISGTFQKIKDKMVRCSTKKELLEVISALIENLLATGSGAENDTQIIARAKEYIYTHYQDNIRLVDVADQVYLTPGYFGVFFKKETGVTFSAYLIQVRIEKAKEMLRDTRYNVSEVAYAVGYQDVRHFSRLFKEHVGLVPKEYRKLNKGNLY